MFKWTKYWLVYRLKHLMVLTFILLSFCASYLHGQEKSSYYVDGSYIYDIRGKKVILRGVNKMTTWTDRAGAAFPEIEKTGANCVRIVMTKKDKPFDLDKWLTQCVDNKMIPIPENHDATGELGGVQAIVDWWCQPGMVDIIKKHERHLLINIANEAGKWGQQSQVKSTYAKAIVQMRDSSIHTPLIIDGSPWGQGADVLLDNYDYWNNLDPDHNIIVSLHFYDGWTDTVKIINTLQQFSDKHIPLIIGEFSEYCKDGKCVPWKKIITECQKLEIGWIWWSWGPENQHQDMSMTDYPKPGLYTNLKGSGKIVAVDHPCSIKNTSVRPASILADASGTTPINKPLSKNGCSPEQISVYPNPFNSTCQIVFQKSNSEIIDITIYDLNGRVIKSYNNCQRQGVINWDGTNNGNKPVAAGVYYVKYQKGTKSIFKKISHIK